MPTVIYQLSFKSRQVALQCCVLGLLFTSFISQANEIDDFIQTAHVSTYDCPDDAHIERMDNLLAGNQLNPQQTVSLKVIKAHWQICVGQYEPARSLLDGLLADAALQKGSYNHASVMYQIGFILDVQEDAARCGYYVEAEKLAKDKYNDVYLSAELGQITVCGQQNEELSIKLGRLFNLLERFLLLGDNAAIAHIHNNIGLLYGSIGQNALAAEQYEKAYQIGLNVYEQKNQAAPLISVISAYMGSGDFANARRMIDELSRINQQVNTPLTNSWLHYSNSRYYLQTGDFEQLRSSMWKWQVYLPQVSNKQMDALFEWYSAELCMRDQQRQCVADFLRKRAEADASSPSRLSRNKDYLRFLVEAQMFLGNLPESQQAFNLYADTLSEKLREQQSSAQVLGVAKLHGEIIALESDLARIRAQHVKSVLMILLMLSLLALLAYFTVGRNYLRKLATDSLTGLLNEQAVLSQIKRVKKPQLDKVNALAVFDMTNFTQVNSEFGHVTGDQLLKRVAKSLKQVVREHDIIGRLGTEQFVVCLKNIDDQAATDLFHRIQAALSELVVNASKGKSVNIDSSMSIYLAIDGFNELEQIIEEMRASPKFKPQKGLA